MKQNEARLANGKNWENSKLHQTVKFYFLLLLFSSIREIFVRPVVSEWLER